MTAIEWLEQKAKEFAIDLDLLSYFQQAKEMEKQQIIDAWLKGVEDEGNPHGHTYFYGETDLAEQYYNKTFKNK